MGGTGKQLLLLNYHNFQDNEDEVESSAGSKRKASDDLAGRPAKRRHS